MEGEDKKKKIRKKNGMKERTKIKKKQGRRGKEERKGDRKEDEWKETMRKKEK